MKEKEETPTDTEIFDQLNEQIIESLKKIDM